MKNKIFDMIINLLLILEELEVFEHSDVTQITAMLYDKRRK